MHARTERTSSIVMRRRLAAIALAAVLVVGVIVLVGRDAAVTPGGAAGGAIASLTQTAPVVREVDAYRGLGAWVDAFDSVPAYQAAGINPPITPAAVADMAAHGVETVYLQAARSDERSPEGIVDRGLLGAFLIASHRAGLRVVGWYLPKFADPAADLAHARAVAEFDVLGHRFDGVALDIEYTNDVPDHALRSQRLVDLSTALRAAMGTDAIGAIVLPPVQTEVVNPAYWPSFPYAQLAPLFDVWMPMSYWTYRQADSGYHDGYTYNEESTRRLRANLGDPAVPVHGIGGVGDLVTPEELTRFVQSIVDTGAIGGSVYDWHTLTPANRALLRDQFAAVAN